MPVRMEDNDEGMDADEDVTQEDADYECEEDESADAEDDRVQVLDSEAVDFSAFCPGEEEMTPQGLATLKRLEASLCNGIEVTDKAYLRNEELLKSVAPLPTAY